MIEGTILSNLMYNEEYFQRVYPYIKEEYFDDISSKKIFASFSDYVGTYKSAPSLEAIKIIVEGRKDVNEQTFKDINTTLDGLKIDHVTNFDWLVSETEKFCQDKDLYNSIRRSILILDGADKEYDKGSIPKLLSDSLGVSFDTNIGHDFLEDFESRYEFYNKKEERLPFDIDILNKITRGGLPKKSLTCLLAETGAGKTLVLCHMAASHLMYGKNVLYITLEMAEERIAERIDANILDEAVHDLAIMDHETYMRKIHRVKSKTTGKLIIKEYPTGSASAANIRYLLNDLRLKKDFKPDVIYIDYLNLMSSARVKNNAANSYTIVKSIAEEIRGLAMEFDVPIVSATQANRSGFSNSDLDITNTSESIGLPATLDAYFALITSEDLEQMGQIMFKQLKNRWGDLNYYKRFVIGIDRSRMKLYNLEDNAQKGVFNEKPTFDNGDFSKDDNARIRRGKPKKQMFDTEGVF